MRSLNALGIALLLSFGLAGCGAGEVSTSEDPGAESALSKPAVQCLNMYSEGTCGGIPSGYGTTVGSACISLSKHHGVCSANGQTGSVVLCACDTAETCQQTTGACAGHQVGARCDAGNGKYAVCDNDNAQSACRCVNTIN